MGGAGEGEVHLPEGAVAWAAHGVGEVAAAEAAGFEPGAEFVEAEAVGRKMEIVGLDHEEFGVVKGGRGAGEDGELVSVGVELERVGAGEIVGGDNAVDGLDGHTAGGVGVGGGDAAAVERGVDHERDLAGGGAGGGGDGEETEPAGEASEGGLTFGEGFEEHETGGGKVAARAEGPRAVGGADVDPGGGGEAAGGGAGEEAVHLEGAVGAREVEAERRERAVGGVAEAGLEAGGHGRGKIRV